MWNERNIGCGAGRRVVLACFAGLWELACWNVGSGLLVCGGWFVGAGYGLLVCEELACWLVGASLLLFLAKDPAKMRKLEYGGVQ